MTTVAILLNWAHNVDNATEYAHWLSLIQVILISLEACQNRLVKSKSGIIFLNKTDWRWFFKKIIIIEPFLYDNNHSKSPTCVLP